MGAASLNDRHELVGLLLQGRAQLLQRGKQFVFNADQRGEMYSCGDNVVGGLAKVDVVVRVHFAGATRAPQQFTGAIGDDLVGVHVGRGAGTGLKNIEDEVVV